MAVGILSPLLVLIKPFAADVKPRGLFICWKGRQADSPSCADFSCEKPNAVNYWFIKSIPALASQFIAYRAPCSGKREWSPYVGSTGLEEKNSTNVHRLWIC